MVELTSAQLSSFHCCSCVWRRRVQFMRLPFRVPLYSGKPSFRERCSSQVNNEIDQRLFLPNLTCLKTEFDFPVVSLFLTSGFVAMRTRPGTADLTEPLGSCGFTPLAVRLSGGPMKYSQVHSHTTTV